MSAILALMIGITIPIDAKLIKLNHLRYILTNICNVLSFSGGGSFGAVEIGILDKI